MKNFKWLIMLGALAMAITFPFVVTDPTFTSLGVYTWLFCAAATAWNLFSGYTGYISLGQATYFGLGAYTMAIVCQDWHIQGGFLPFLILPLTGFITCLFALPIGWITLRAKGYVFIVLTLAIFFIFQTLANNLSTLTGGSAGIYLPDPPWDATFLDMPFYFVALALFLLALLVAWGIRVSHYGLRLLAIRDDEERTQGLGVKTYKYKLIAYVISALFTGMVGALTSYYTGNVSPDTSFSPTFDVLIALIVFMGGRGTILGPPAGAILLVPLQQFFIQQYGATQLVLVLYGGVLLLVLLLLPQGIIPTLSTRWQAWMTTQHRHRQRQALQPYIPALTEGSSQSAGLIDLPTRDTRSLVIDQRPASHTIPPPRSPTPWARSQPTSAELLQRIKSQRLVPQSHDDSPMTIQASGATPLETTPTPKGDQPMVSWRCPGCGKPFLLKGTSCYCPRCGVIRSLLDG